MYPNNFYIPSQTMRFMPNGIGLSSSRSGGLFSSLKSINWGNLLNNANKTLNVVNQTIPLVRQAGPMLNNMKSMIKLASAFKDETDTKENKKNIISNTTEELNNKSLTNYTNNIINNQPNFFI